MPLKNVSMFVFKKKTMVVKNIQTHVAKKSKKLQVLVFISKQHFKSINRAQNIDLKLRLPYTKIKKGQRVKTNSMDGNN